MIRIMIVDDHPLLRDAVSTLISETPELEFTVVGMAGDADNALSEIKTSSVDMIVVDISLGGLDGIELIKTIRSLGCEARILVLSMYDELLYAERAIEAGADGYVMKNQEPSEIFHAICTVARGDVYFSNKILSKLIKGNVNCANNQSLFLHSLSDRELETFNLLGLGWKTHRIADEMHVSIKTVETYCAHIKRKLNLEDFNQLITHAAHCVSSGELEHIKAKKDRGV